MFQKPIRTYGRKNEKQPLVENYKLRIRVSLNKQSPSIYTNLWDESSNRSDVVANGSMDYNPFEDTFDRLVNDVKIPEPLKSNDNTWNSNSTDDDDQNPTKAKRLCMSQDESFGTDKIPKNTLSLIDIRSPISTSSEESLDNVHLFERIAQQRPVKVIKKRACHEFNQDNKDISLENANNSSAISTNGSIKFCCIKLQKIDHKSILDDTNNKSTENITTTSLDDDSDKQTVSTIIPVFTDSICKNINTNPRHMQEPSIIDITPLNNSSELDRGTAFSPIPMLTNSMCKNINTNPRNFQDTCIVEITRLNSSLLSTQSCEGSKMSNINCSTPANTLTFKRPVHSMTPYSPYDKSISLFSEISTNALSKNYDLDSNADETSIEPTNCTIEDSNGNSIVDTSITNSIQLSNEESCQIDEIVLEGNQSLRISVESSYQESFDVETRLEGTNGPTQTFDDDKLFVSYILLERLDDNSDQTNPLCSKSNILEIEHQGENDCTETNVTNNTDDFDTVEPWKESNLKLKDIECKSVFLKPGKCWARSLSILNFLQNGQNVDLMASGKGRKWRHSVRDILDMQEKGVIQSCVNLKDERDTETSTKYKTCHENSEFSNNLQVSLQTSQSALFYKRSSIRVIPDEEIDKEQNVEFLKAYGYSSNTILSTIKPVSRELDNKNESLPNEEEAITARQVVLDQCLQESYIPFEQCFSKTFFEQCHKIGEGVYGEVFLYQTEQEQLVIKIIPIEGDQLVNGEPQKKFNEILSEIVIAKALHGLILNDQYNTNAYVEVKNVRCVVGKYPEKLVELWKIYDEEKTSDNDSPAMFESDQLYIVFELGHGGQDLEAFIFKNSIEAIALFMQIAFALAIAEKSLEFEHRDLHWGNILITRTEEEYIKCKLQGETISLPTKGVQASIIDFTLSRMYYQRCCIFNDLSLDPALFTAQGEYQFEIYRLMRNKINNDWKKFEPHTNVLWLHYILDKMITAARYKKKTTKVHKNGISILTELKEAILNYPSAFDLVNDCDKITEWIFDGTPSGKTDNQPTRRNLRARKLTRMKIDSFTRMFLFLSILIGMIYLIIKDGDHISSYSSLPR